MLDEFCFGQYLISVESKQQLPMFLSKEWQYTESSDMAICERVIFHLEEKGFLTSRSFNDGWNLQHCEGYIETVYSCNGNALFTLRYSFPLKEVYVLIDSIQHSNQVKLGIQYGIMLALYQHCIGLHGVTLICGNEIIILSAPSGTGKTTLAKLLEKYCDGIIINGDFALLSPTEDGVIYEPTPFCGSSGRSLNHRFRVSRVVFLGQAEENHWRELDGREVMTQFMNNTFVPEWDQEITQTIQGNILKCIGAVKVNAYDFTPTQEAAEVFLKELKVE